MPSPRPKKKTRRFVRLAFWRHKNRRTRADSAPPDLSGKTVPNDAAARRPRRSGLVLRLLGAITLAGALGGAGYGVHSFLCHSQQFAIRAVRISPTRHVRGEALIQRAAIPLGQSLFRLDLRQIEERLRGEPWLRQVRVRREMPSTVAIDVVENEPAALLALGALYLTDAEGGVFKRAAQAEGAGLPVITGISRDGYVMDVESRARIQKALAAHAAFCAVAGRPQIGEIHVDGLFGVTLYTMQGVAVRLGQADPAEWPARLARFDAVWAAVQREGLSAALLFLDNRAHPDHVTVRLMDAL